MRSIITAIILSFFSSISYAGSVTFINPTSASLSSSVYSDDAYLGFGNTLENPDAAIGWNTTQTVDGLYLGLSDGQNTFVIGEYGDVTFDFAHSAQTNPTIFLHSASKNTTQWLSLSHNQTNAVINTGTGGILLKNVLFTGQLIQFDPDASGTVITNGNYQYGFDADSQLHANVPTGFSHIFSINGTERLNITAATSTFTTNITSNGFVKSSSVSAGIGYAAGAGSTVTQQTSKSTAVTLNAITGQITMNGAALGSATNVTFTVSDSSVAATDTIIINHNSAGTSGAYIVWAHTIGSGSFLVTVRNTTAGSLSEAIVLGFSVIKAVTS